ncbi:MAG: nucleotidyltransferase domain-containing protein [Nitrospirae bacterium]|nr:nucleotidyltransferase domain-containing protein [Nitrospirota bacterium]
MLQTTRREKLKKLAEEFNLDLIVLFRLEKGLPCKKNDLDIAIRCIKSSKKECSEKWDMGLAKAMAEIFNKSRIQIYQIENADPFLLFEIAYDGVSIYERSPETYAAFQSWALDKFKKAEATLKQAMSGL